MRTWSEFLRELSDKIDEQRQQRATLVKNYRCSGCDAHNGLVALWRTSDTTKTRTLCRRCAEKAEKTTLRRDRDEIGQLVPAIPVDVSCQAYWEPLDAPTDRVEWWRSLSWAIVKGRATRIRERESGDPVSRDTDVTIEWYRYNGEYIHDTVHITKGGVTGFESFVPSNVGLPDWDKFSRRGWCACAGTVGRWDMLIVSPETMRRLYEVIVC